jgi:hypothetical protein
MNCKTEFLSQQNINILWDIIYENMIYNKKEVSLDTIKVIFSNLINYFGANEKMQTLIETNKKFITMINNKLNEHASATSSKPLITFNDIQKDRTNLFEKKLIEKQNDFNNLIKKQVPDAPNFKDNIDTPIEEFDSLIKKTIEQRNADIVKINKKKEMLHPQQFLKSLNTSIKSEKNELNQIKIDYLNTENKLKNFTITDLTPIDIDKKVTWDDEVKEKPLEVALDNLKLEQNFLEKLKLFETPPKPLTEIVSQNMDITKINDKLDILLSQNMDITKINDKLDILLSQNMDITKINDKLDILLSQNMDITKLNDKLDILLSRIDLILNMQK